ncbi:MAG: galactose-1-epimerase, partial [Clostridia bacterium]|nr:galactose-1-epimerase [Clostridia bacterium]
DFTKGRKIADDIDTSFDQLLMTGGYDHNFVIDGYDKTVKMIAKVEDPGSGRVMEVYSDLPGVQFYAGNAIAPQTGKGGAKYSKRMGLCLETQFFPDSVNKPSFPSCVFGGGSSYASKTVYKFK